MICSKRLTALVVLGAGIAASTARLAGAGEAAEGRIVEPMRSVEIDLGSKQGVGYFDVHEGTCSLTLVLTETAAAAGAAIGRPARFQVVIDPGKEARLDGDDGKGVAFFCGPGGARMSVRSYDWTARS